MGGGGQPAPRGECNEGMGRLHLEAYTPPPMARNKRSRRGGTLYRQVATETANLGQGGEQIHLGTVEPLDPALRGCYLENIRIHVIPNQSGVFSGSLDDDDKTWNGPAQMPSFTFYLSYESDSWSDDAIIAASSTSQGGGNLNLVAKRSIWTDQSGSTVAEQLGPIQLWCEATQVGLDGASTDVKARYTVEVWGRMFKFDFV